VTLPVRLDGARAAAHAPTIENLRKRRYHRPGRRRQRTVAMTERRGPTTAGTPVPRARHLVPTGRSIMLRSNRHSHRARAPRVFGPFIAVAAFLLAVAITAQPIFA